MSLVASSDKGMTVNVSRPEYRASVRRLWRRRTALVASVVIAASCAPPVAPETPTTTTTTTSTSTTTTTTTTIPPQTSAIYMTDNIDLSNVAAGTIEASVGMRVATRGCSDFDSCLNGVRRSTGYVWFSAFGVNFADTPTSSVYYGMHGGLAFGGSGKKSQMYLDWSGYCPDAYGGGPLRHGGTACSSPSNNPTQKPHTVVNLSENRWYTIAVRKVACSVSEVTDIPGPLTGWEIILTDDSTAISQSGGTWCLPNAPFIAHTSLFNEIIEYRGPCVTDFGSVEFRDPKFRTVFGWTGHTTATGHYNGGNTPLDAACGNTNLRKSGPQRITDERMVPRGSNGGLAGDGAFLWP